MEGQTPTVRQKERWTDGKMDGHTDKLTECQIDRGMEGQTYGWSDEQIDKWKETDGLTEIVRRADRWTN